MNGNVATVSPDSDTSIQAQIESVMKHFHDEERWETVFLFSSEGLPMANHGASAAYGEENLLEFAFSLMDGARLIADDLPIKEITVRGKSRKRLVFRYFRALGDELVLGAVVSGRRGYRRALNRLVKHIQSLGE